VSIASLSTLYADRYVNLPTLARRPGGAGGAAPQPVPADVLKTLTAYIPSELITVYLAGVAAIHAASALPPEQLHQYDVGFFIACLVLSPILGTLGVWVASKSTPTAAAVIFPAAAACIAFVAYAAAIPNGVFGISVFGTLAVLVVTPFLHACALAYQRFFPPPSS
jgi:hypothetical protein